MIDIKTLNDIQKGYISDLEVSGHTLVNLFDNSKGNYTWDEVTADRGIYEISSSRNTQGYIGKNFAIGWKANTTYTLIMKVIQSTGNMYGSFTPSFLGSNGIEYFDTTIPDNFTGTYIGKITTATALDEIVITAVNNLGLRIGSDTVASGGTLKIDNIMLLEGDYTNNPPSYFKGTTAVGQKIDNSDSYNLKMTCSNVNHFDLERHAYNLKKDGDYIIALRTTNYEVDYHLKKNTAYNISFNKTAGEDSWIAVIVNGQYSNNGNLNYSKDFTTGNDGILKVSIRANTYENEGHRFKDFMIVEAEHKPEVYTNHASYDKNIILPRRLNGFNGLSDKLWYDGKEWIIEKWIGEVILREDRIIDRYYGGTDKTQSVEINFELLEDNIILPKTNGFVADILVPSYRTDTSNNTWNKDITAFAISIVSGVTTYRLSVKTSVLPDETIAGAREFIKNNPVQVFYKHVTPEVIHTGITDINALTVKTYDGITYLSFNNENLDPKIKFRYPMNSESIHINNVNMSSQQNYKLDNVRNLKDISQSIRYSSEDGYIIMNDSNESGYINNIKLKGKSLVNLITTDTSQGILVQSVNSGPSVALGSNSQLVNGKTYTLIYECSNVVGTEVATINFQSATKKPDVEIPITNGINVKVFTMPQDPLLEKGLSTSIYYFFDNHSCIMKNIVLLEGDHANDVDTLNYFKGINFPGKNKEILLKSSGSNLLNIDGIKYQTSAGSYYEIEGQNIKVIAYKDFEVNSYCWVKFYMPIDKSIKKIRFSANYYSPTNVGKSYGIRFLDINLNNIGNVYINKNGSDVICDIPNGTLYLSLLFYSVFENQSTGKAGEYCIYSNIELYDITDTDGKPRYNVYKESKKSLTKPIISNDVVAFEPIKLRSLDGEIYDYIEKHNNVYRYIENCSDVILNENSNFTIATSGVPSNTNFLRVNFTVPGVLAGVKGKLISDRFEYYYIHGLAGGSVSVTKEGICNHSSDPNIINLIIRKNRLVTPDTAGLRAWLKDNNINVIFSLVNPIVTDLPYDLNLLTHKHQTSVTTDTGTIKPEISFSYTPGICDSIKKIMDKTEDNNKLLLELYRYALSKVRST